MKLEQRHLVIIAGLAFIAGGIYAPGIIKAMAEHPEALHQVLQAMEEAQAKREAAQAIQEAQHRAHLVRRWGRLAPLALWLDKRIR